MEATIRRLIADLGRDEDAVQERAVAELIAIGEPAIEPLIATLFTSGSSSAEAGQRRQWLAAQILSRGGEPAFRALRRAITSANKDVRRGVALTLGQINDPRAADLLIDVLQDDRDWQVQDAAAFSLGAIAHRTHSAHAHRAMLDMLTHSSRYVRAHAVNYLMFQPLDVVINTLADILLNYQADPAPRQTAAERMGYLDDVRAVPPLMRALITDDSGWVRTSALESLKMLHAGGHVPGELVDALVIELNNSDPKTRQIVATILGELRDAQAVEPLIHVLQADSDKSVRNRVATALGKLKDPRAGDALLDALEDGIKTAVEALAAIGDRRAIEPLHRLIQSRDWRLRHTVLSALCKLGDSSVLDILIDDLNAVDEPRHALELLRQQRDPRTVEPLIRFMRTSPHEPLRAEAARILGEIGDRRAVESLMMALRSTDTTLVEVAALALGDIGDNRSVQALLRALDQGVMNAAVALGKLKDRWAVKPLMDVMHNDTLHHAMRILAARALGEIGDPAPIPVLLEWLHHPDTEYQRCAVDALVNMGTPALEPLLQALRYRQALARQNAAQALGKLHLPGAIPALIEALSDPVMLVRVGAVVALIELGAPAVEPLIEALDHQEIHVRVGAVEALGAIKDARAVEPLQALVDDTNTRLRKSVRFALRQIENNQPAGQA
ncbi:MAG: hypothetical protein OHK0046_29630 [Anaerolineae bacterium]